SLTGKGNDNKKQKEQKIVVNVHTGNQPTQASAQTKPAEQPKSEMSKKEFSDAMKILRKRYASGEINKQQFDEMKKELEE
ncbi:MAG: SHOCT domain-containing protein, partial [Candidatus Diapherotrites archaeon]